MKHENTVRTEAMRIVRTVQRPSQIVRYVVDRRGERSELGIDWKEGSKSESVPVRVSEAI